MAGLPLLVVEDDPFTRLIELVLDPTASAQRHAAFADFMSPDEPHFDRWIEGVRAKCRGLYPARVRMVESEQDMRSHLGEAIALVVESFRVGRAEIEAGRALRAVQKFGALVRNIDLAACEAAGVKVLTLRRRANVSCAEHVFALMLALARRLFELNGRVTATRIPAMKPFDRRHTPGGNYGRFSGTRSLNESTLGIIGLGEIGREIALRAAAFGMRTLYYQRTRLVEDEERALQASYMPLDTLLSESDWIVPQLPSGPATAGLIDAAAFARMKRGACLINVANPGLIRHDDLVAALASGHLGGAGLDVYEREPVPEDEPLLQFENALLMPHMAGSPRFNGLRDFEQLITGLAREVMP